MRRLQLARCAIGPLLSVALLTFASAASAQDIEPRAFSNAPTGVNFLITGYGFTRGGLSFDPAVPVTDAQLRTSSAILAYARELDLWGMSGKFDAIVPYTWLSGTATFKGQPVERTVAGLDDALFRLSVNFYGAPALTAKEFAAYQQDLIVGASLQISVPVGQYDQTRVVNLGTNRWFFRPELGVSKALGPLTLEIMPAVTAYTANTNFYNGYTRTQEPIYSLQGHAIYSFGSGIWAAADVTYFTGGSTAINGMANNDLQQNWRAGATLSFPIDAGYSVKLYASRGVSARTHDNYDLIGIQLQYHWGGGL
jgi:hypothetical protein